MNILITLLLFTPDRRLYIHYNGFVFKNLLSKFLVMSHILNKRANKPRNIFMAKCSSASMRSGSPLGSDCLLSLSQTSICGLSSLVIRDENTNNKNYIPPLFICRCSKRMIIHDLEFENYIKHFGFFYVFK